MRVKGFARAGAAVVNMDATEYENIKRERARKRSEDSLRTEMSALRGLVERLLAEVEAMKRG